ncbi:hypothetical protein [Variovorax paradoxus]|uniref:hypothetical protein n=1 Tax=Variovorax paradoxus TaxID=34073 RepID=UPI003D646F58
MMSMFSSKSTRPNWVVPRPVIVAAGVAIAVPRIQKLDRGNNATFELCWNATLQLCSHRADLYNLSYVKLVGEDILIGGQACGANRIARGNNTFRTG